jgi:hypothetical protein
MSGMAEATWGFTDGTLAATEKKGGGSWPFWLAIREEA